MLVQGLQPTLTALDYPIRHGCAAEGNAFSGPDFLLSGQRQAIHIFLRHDIRYRRGRGQRMLHKGNWRLYSSNVRKPRILLTFVTGIGNSIVSRQLYLLGNNLHFMAQEFLANGFHFPAAFAADQLLFREFQKYLLFRNIVQHFCLAAFLFPLVGLYKNGILGRLLRFGGLLFFRFIEKAFPGCLTRISKSGGSGFNSIWIIIPPHVAQQKISSAAKMDHFEISIAQVADGQTVHRY